MQKNTYRRAFVKKSWYADDVHDKMMPQGGPAPKAPAEHRAGRVQPSGERDAL